jgi:hypothetical protein
MAAANLDFHTAGSDNVTASKMGEFTQESPIACYLHGTFV